MNKLQKITKIILEQNQNLTAEIGGNLTANFMLKNSKKVEFWLCQKGRQLLIKDVAKNYETIIELVNSINRGYYE